MNRASYIRERVGLKFLISGIWKHISRKRKIQLVLLSLLMLFSGIAEIFSLAAVVPFLSVLSNPQYVWELPISQSFIKVLRLQSPNDLLLLITIIFSFAAIIAAAFRLINLWGNCRLASLIGSDISCKAYQKTLYQKYKFHLNRNTSSVVAATTTEINLTVSTIDYFLQLFTSFIVVTSIITTLVFINFKVAFLASFVFGSAYLIMSILVRKRLNLNSKVIAFGINEQLKILQEGLGAIRDILLDGNQSTYLEIYRKADIPRRRRQADSQFLAVFPRYTLEALGLVLIAALAISLMYQNNNSYLILPTLGTLALGSQRLLPALQQFYAAWAAIKSNAQAVRQVLEILDLQIPKSESQIVKTSMKFEKNFVLKEVDFSYSNNPPFILKSINLEVCAGDRLGIIGKTGSGKSTIVDIIMGLVEPSKGDFLVDNKNIFDKNYPQRIAKWRSNIAHVPQSIYLADRTIAENIAFGLYGNNIDMKLVKTCARKTQLDSFINNSKDGYKTMVGERGIRLSGGQRQRIGIARALYKNAKILILDEATSALDSVTEEAVINSITSLNENLTIIMIAHRESTLEKCNKIIKISNGSLIQMRGYKK